MASESLTRRAFLRRAALAATAGALGPELFSAAPSTPKRITPNTALRLALLDLAQLPRESQLFTRYLWVQSGEFEDLQALSLAINLVSRSPNIVRLVPVARGLLGRLDLRHYYPEERDLNEAVKIWEELQFDARWNFLLTKDTLRFAAEQGIDLGELPKDEWGKVPVAPYIATDGKRYDFRWERRAGGVELVRKVGRHIDPEVIAALIDRTQSQAPVVTGDYFLTRALSTFKSANKVFSTIFGGLYYDLVGVPRDSKKGTDLDNLLAKLGIGADEKNVFNRADSEQRVAIFESDVALKKPRRVDILPSRSSKPNEAQPIVSITHDLNKASIDVGTHPMMNLRQIKADAFEVIWTKANGLQGYAIYDGAGKLLDEADQNVVADNSIPIPYGTRLEAAISCVRCHGRHDGWQPLRNDVTGLVKGGVDIFNDRSARGKTQAAVIAELTGQYAGDPERQVMPRARDDNAARVLRATGPWKGRDQARAAVLGMGRIAEMFARYNYTSVSAKSLLAELGIEGDINQLLLPARVIDAGAGVPVVSEDVRIGQLKAGKTINRADADLVMGFVAGRLRK